MSIVLGLIGLGIVVFIHELGHFIAAKLSGIHVEVFSLGWGKRLWGVTYRGTEYRLSVLPIGGYCKLKGEEAYTKGNTESGVSETPGSFYSASPIKRIFIAFSGPAANLLFAVFAFTIVWLIGFTYPTFPNRIILESDFPTAASRNFPATEGGLQTGDEIIAIDGSPIITYRDIQEIVARSPNRALTFTFRRNNVVGEAVVTPELNLQTGGGRIGVYAWIDPVIEAVRRDSSAFIAGLIQGDSILEVDGEPAPHTLFVTRKLRESRARPVQLTILRDGTRQEIRIIPHFTEAGGLDLGVTFKPIVMTDRSENLVQAFLRGLSETKNTLRDTVRGIGMLFSGINLSQAVSGPIRITYYVGEIATQGFGRNFLTGITSSLSFLSLLSVTLFIMNLLPIPVLDGGLILVSFSEMLLRRRLPPKFMLRYQYFGFIIILSLILLSTMSDVLFFFRR